MHYHIWKCLHSFQNLHHTKQIVDKYTIAWWYLDEALLTSNHNICFHGEPRKLSVLFGWKSTLSENVHFWQKLCASISNDGYSWRKEIPLWAQFFSFKSSPYFVGFSNTKKATFCPQNWYSIFPVHPLQGTQVVCLCQNVTLTLLQLGRHVNRCFLTYAGS